MRLLLLLPLLVTACAAQDPLPGFRTDVSRRIIDLSELRAGGPPKGGIPALDAPRFVPADEAATWLAPQEPVVLLTIGGEARAYPLQILTWHEIANDRVGGVPVAVTFCPLCYSALVFERVVGRDTLDFGVSGFLRHSDLVMYDRQTETLWQQLTGEGLVGEHAGTALREVPAQLVSFAQFREAHPEGPVLSRATGHDRPYGRNPYAGYDDLARTPFLFDGPPDDRLLPMEKVIAVNHEGAAAAWAHRLTREARVLHDTLGGRPVLVLHLPGAVTALGAERIAVGAAVGTTGVFSRVLDGRTLTFRWTGSAVEDEQTGSRWSATGRAESGPLTGRQLDLLPHVNAFAFAWLAFRPDARLVSAAPPR